jgi:hypothetical protein
MAGAALALAPTRPVALTPIRAPRTPFPAESLTAGVTRFSFIAYGDTRSRQDGKRLQAEHERVVASMLATIRRARTSADSIRFVLQSGDAVTNGAIAAQLAVSYVPLIDRLTQQGNGPYFLAVGNHDVGSSANLLDPRRLAGLRNYLEVNAELLPRDGSPRRLTGYPVYAFGYGNSFFMALDSHIADDPSQLAWMRQQLESLDRSRYVNVVAFVHHPVYSSGPHGLPTEAQTQTIRDLWMPLFRKHHVRLLFAGHDHVFEHWVERYTDSTGTHRMDQIVSGGGGAPLYGHVEEPDVAGYLAASADQRLSLEHLVRAADDPGDNPYHYVVVHVDGSQLSVEVIAVDLGKRFAPYPSVDAVLADSAR